MTFLAVLMVIVVMGIMMGVTGQSWKMTMKREKEKELLFRGNQIKEAIERWNKPRARPLNKLEDLVTDPNSLKPKRYLRRLFTDPMTGKEWTLLRGICVGSATSTPTPGLSTTTPSPAQSTIQTGPITGVASTSEEEPLKTDFTDIPTLKNLGGMKKYSDWKFCADKANADIQWKTWDSYHEGN